MNSIDKLKKENRKLKVIYAAILAYMYALIIYMVVKDIVKYFN